MRALGAFCLALALTGPAIAQNRIDARDLDCRTVQAIIFEDGAAVLTTGRHTYERYVAGWQFCASPDVPRPDAIRTADTNQCPVYRCAPPLFDDWND